SAPHILNGHRPVNRATSRPVLLLAEARRGVGRDIPVGMERTRLHEELLLALGVVGIRYAAVDGTDRGALLLVEEPDALGAFLRNDVIDVLLQGGMAAAAVLPHDTTLVDRGVRAFGLARATVDALLGDHRGHRRRTITARAAATQRGSRSRGGRRSPSGEQRCDAVAERDEGAAHRVRGIRGDDGTAGVARGAHGGNERDPAEKRDVEPTGETLSAARPEDRVLGPAPRADVRAHVLDHA